MSEKARKNWQVAGWLVLVILAVLTVVAVLNRQWVVDWFNGLGYQPAGEMLEIREDLALADRGEFLFKATGPVLMQAEEFNQTCREGSSETAVLGCYVGDKVYVYDIAAEELDGIREVTTAHELLHAVWARMSEGDRMALSGALEQVLAENSEVIGGEIAAYDANVQREEIYVRAGTEVRDLPEELEEHFGEIFKNRGRIVDFYDNYIAVFRAVEARAEQLEQEIASLEAKIEAEMDEYEVRAGQLAGRVADFNACAGRAGCFSNQSEFYAERNELLGEQADLATLNQTINAEIDTYNAKVTEYNQNVVRGQKLQAMVNSTASPEVGL